MAKTEDRFIKTYTQGSSFSSIVQIWVDKQTGVNYLFHAYGYAGGLTPPAEARWHTGHHPHPKLQRMTQQPLLSRGC